LAVALGVSAVVVVIVDIISAIELLAAAAASIEKACENSAVPNTLWQ
jgi:hypothetical protein